jgi:hypothetical protein
MVLIIDALGMVVERAHLRSLRGSDGRALVGSESIHFFISASIPACAMASSISDFEPLAEIAPTV